MKNLMSLSALCFRRLLFILLLVSSVGVHALPTTPNGFRFDVYSDTTIELFWLRSSGNPLVIGYELTKDGESLGFFDALSYVDTTLTQGSTHEFSLTAIDANGDRSQTVSVVVKIPSSPAEQIAILQEQLAELQAQLDQTDLSTNGDPAAPVLQTGQVDSFAFGDDGDFQSGLVSPRSRFRDNGNGTFTDMLTDITWMGIYECMVKRSWHSALDYANNLSANGDLCPELNDRSSAGEWRLPNIKELYSLVDIAQDFPALAGGMPFSGASSDHFFEKYWSSSSFQPVPDSHAFVLDLPFGLIDSYPKTQSDFYVWPVRVTN